MSNRHLKLPRRVIFSLQNENLGVQEIMGQRNKDLGTVFKPGLKDLVYAVPRRLAGRMTQRPPDKYQVVIQRAGILSVQLNNV